MPIEKDGTPTGPDIEGVQIDRVEVNGNIVYSGGPTLGTTVSVPQPGNSDSSSNLNGLYFNVADTQIVGIRVQIATGDFAPSGYDQIRAVDGFGSNIGPAEDVSGVSPGDTYDYYFDSGRTADFGIGLERADGGSYTRSRFESPSYPYTGTEFDVSDGMYGDAPQLTQNVAYNFEDVTPILEA